jgi:hypothetical protein
MSVYILLFSSTQTFNMLQQIVELFNALFKILYYCVLISYNIGKILVEVGNAAIQLTKTTTIYLCQFLVLFYEEYSNFFREIVETISNLLTAISEICVNGTLELFRVPKLMLESGFKLIKSGNLKITNVGYGIVYSMAWALDMTKKLGILIGNGVWFLITLMPNAFYNLALHMYETTCLSINLFKSLSYGGLVNALAGLENIWDFFKDVPLRSLLGLIFIYAIYTNSTPVIHYGSRITLKMYNVCRIVVTKIIILLQTAISSMNRIRLSRLRVTHQVDDLLNDSSSPIQQIQPATTRSRRSRLNVETDESTVASSRPAGRKPISRTSPKKKPTTHDDTDSNLCIICQDARKSVVLFPCRHLCLCAACSDNLSRYRRECPLCRTPIFRQINVFV